MDKPASQTPDQNNPNAPRPILILGPTAGGKSDLAVGLAEKLGITQTQVIGADSMQVYRHLNAGTAKPSAQLRQRVQHHLIDIVEPTRGFTVVDWLDRAKQIIESLQAQGNRAIIVGGTNLYLKALLQGLFVAPGRDTALREQLEPISSAQLHQRLLVIDRQAADRIHRNDRKKLVRALEVYHLTGQPISQLQTQWSDLRCPDTDMQPFAKSDSPGQHPSGGDDYGPYHYDPILIGLDWPIQAINRRINQRVKEMFQTPSNSQIESLPQEVTRLHQLGMLGPQASLALGYKQVLEHLDRRCTLTEAFEKTKVMTRRFSKNQRTWYKRFRGVHWIGAADRSTDDLVHECLTFITDEK